MKLKTHYGKTYNLDLVKSEYLNNKKPYLWLIDKKDGEYFSDITVNLPTGKTEYNYIDFDFIECCFSYIGDTEKRLRENLKIKDFGKDGDYYYFTL